MKKIVTKPLTLGVILPLLLTLFSTIAQAQNVNFSTQASTLGAGLNLGYKITNSLAFRANINGMIVNHNFNATEMTYRAKINLRTAGLLADYYPFSNGFHLTLGAYYNDNNIQGNGVFTQSYPLKMGNKTVYVNPNNYGSMKFDAHYNRFSPYIGIGYQFFQQKPWSVDVSAGVLYQGNAHVTYDIPTTFEGVKSIQSSINENKQRIQNRANDLKWYPVINVALSYKF